MAITQTDVAKLYIAMFDRAPEKAGLDYWYNEAESGKTLAQIADEMAAAAKAYPDIYPQYANYNPDDADSVKAVINDVYKILFNKDDTTDAKGVNYWVDQITSGKMDLGTAVVTLEKAAEEYLNSDDAAAKAAAETFENRADAAVKVADILPSADVNGDGKIDATDFSTFQNIITKVTAKTSTINTAVTDADNYAPKNFDLTDGVDKLVGTDGPNVFNASLLTLNAGDSIDGKGGVDTLNAEINSDVNNVTLNSVENVKITSYGNHVVNMSKMSGVQTVESLNSTGTLSLNNVNAKTGLAVKGLNQTLNASYTGLTGTNDVLNLKLDNATNASVSVSSGFEKMDASVNGANSIKTFNHMPTDITMSGDGSVNFKGNITVQNLNVGKDIALSVGKDTNADGFNDSASLKTSSTDNSTINLGDKADNLTIVDQAPANKTVTVNMGGGDDHLTFTKGTATDVIDLGSGNNSMILKGQALTSSDLIKAGDGKDTLTVTNTGANSMVLMGMDNLVLGPKATGANVINFADSPLNVTIKAKGNAFSLTGLSDGSTVKVVDAKNKTAGIKGLTIGYMKPQDNATVTIDTKANLTNVLKLTNIDDATVKANKSLTGGQKVSLKAVNTLNLTAAKTLKIGNVTDTATTDTLKNVKITAPTVTVGNIKSTALTSVKAEAAKNKLTVGTLGNTKANVTSISLKAAKTVTGNQNITAKTLGTVNITSTNANVNLATKAIKATNTISKVNINAKTTAAVNTIKSTNKDINNVKVVASTKTAKVGTISAKKGKIGNVTIQGNAKATAGKITANTIGTINITSAKGAVTAKTITVANSLTDLTLKGLTKVNVTNANNANNTVIKAKTINTINISSSTGNVNVAKAIKATNTLKTLNVNAKTKAVVKTIKSTGANIDNVKVVASTKAAKVNIISAAKGNISNVTLKGASVTVTKTIKAKTIDTVNITATSTKGSANVNKITATNTLSKVNIASNAGAKVTASIAAKNLGNVKIVGNGNLTVAKIATTGKDSDGFNVTLKAGAKGAVSAANNGKVAITNKTGNINNVLITGKKANVSLTSRKSGYVKNVNLAGVISGAKAVISNNETSAGIDSKTVVSLGGNSTKATNTITFKGSVDAINVYGGKGKDNINLSLASKVDALLNLGTGSNKVTVTNAGKSSTVKLNGSANDNIILKGTKAISSITVTGNLGNNSIAINGNQTLSGKIYGGNGNDTITLSNSNANTSFTLDGQSGNDTYVVGSNFKVAKNQLKDTGSTSDNDTLQFNASKSIAGLTSDGSSKKLNTDMGIEKIKFGANNVTGTVSAAQISGESLTIDSNNKTGDFVKVTGGTGADIIDLSNLKAASANTAQMIIDGGKGADTITAGALTDNIVLSSPFNAADKIKDFKSGNDKIKFNFAKGAKTKTLSSVNKLATKDLSNSSVKIITKSHKLKKVAGISKITKTAGALTANELTVAKNLITAKSHVKSVTAKAATAIVLAYTSSNHKLYALQIIDSKTATAKVGTKIKSTKTVATITLTNGGNLGGADIAIF